MSTFTLPAELTIAYAAQTREALLQALADGCTEFDARQVDAIDTSGVQLLLALQRSLQANQTGLTLLAPSVAVLDALRLYGLGDLLTPSH